MPNHPSGDPMPSQADVQMTKAIVDIAAPLGISVHDHIIVGKNGHAQQGRTFRRRHRQGP